jgi:thiol-disulfide isomerase/thioredoxin
MGLCNLLLIDVKLVDFYAPWCGPCKMQMPIVEESAKENGNQVNIAKVNIDEESDLSWYGCLQCGQTKLWPIS